MVDLDETFFAQFDPSGGVTDEAALRIHFEKSYIDYFATEAKGMLRFNMQKKIVDTAEIPLDEDLLARIYTGKPSKYDIFLRSVRWMVIQSNFMQHHSIKVTEAAINRSVSSRLRKMFGGSSPDWLTDEMVGIFKKSMLEREDTRREILEEALLDEVLDKMIELSTLNKQQVDLAAFTDVVKAFNAEFGDGEYGEEE